MRVAKLNGIHLGSISILIYGLLVVVNGWNYTHQSVQPDPWPAIAAAKELAHNPEAQFPLAIAVTRPHARATRCPHIIRTTLG
jgi:hypothetical protein